MSFGIFGKKRSESVALVDVRSAAVVGALAVFTKGSPPDIFFTTRVPIAPHENETGESAMVRALTELTELLVKAGGPTLHRETGSGHIDRVFASIASPWQETKVHTKTIEQPKPFVFTRQLVHTANFGTALPENRVSSGEFIVATFLNGYEVERPYGKQAKRVDLVILSSSLHAKVASAVKGILERAFHTRESMLTAFAPLAYEVLRDLYPHEKDFLVLDVTGESTDIAFVKDSVLADVASLPLGAQSITRVAHEKSGMVAAGGEVIDPARTSTASVRVKEAEKKWLDGLGEILRDFSSRHALSRSLFLISDKESSEYLKKLLDSESLHRIWLSDDPLTVIPVLPSHFTPYVKTKGEAVGDSILMMLALAYQKQRTA